MDRNELAELRELEQLLRADLDMALAITDRLTGGIVRLLALDLVAARAAASGDRRRVKDHDK